MLIQAYSVETAFMNFLETIFQRSLPKFAHLFVPATFILLFAERSAAQTSWAAASGNWNMASSWTPAIVPGEGTNATITIAGTYTVTYNSPMSAGSIASLTLGSATSIPTLTITAAGFDVTGSNTLVDSSAEVLNINSGGVMTNGTLNMASRNALVNVNSGGILTNGTTQVGNNGSNDGSGRLTVNPGATASLGAVSVGRHNQSATIGLIIAGGSVSASSIDIGTRNSYATMAVTGGTVANAGNLRLGTGSATAGREVRYHQTGGTVAVAGTVDLPVASTYTTWFNVLGAASAFSADGIRLYPNAVSGAVARFTNSGSIYLGASGFKVLNSGTYTVALNDQSLLGATADWSGNVNMVTGSGTVTFKAAADAGTAHNITLTNVISGAANLTKTGGGTLSLYGANTYAGATIVSAGSLVLGNAGALPKGTALTLGGSGTAGILDLAGYNAQISGLASGGVAASQIVTNSSAVNTSTLTFSNGAANAIFGGIIAGGSKPIALTLLGGNLTLSGQNNYAGNIFIGSGQFMLSGAGSTFTGPAIVLSNSTAILDVSGMGGLALSAGQSLSGSGTVTGNVVAANCLISPGTSGGAGALTFTNGLTLNGGTTSHFDLALDPNAAGNDLIVVGGALNLSGTNTIDVSPLGASLSAGTYKLIKFGILGSGGAANFQLTGTLGPSLQSAVGVTVTEVDLIVSPVGGTQRTWKGDGSTNNWDYTTANWLNGSTTDVFSDGNLVTFDDTGSNTPPINLTATLQPATVLVNAAANYTFSGSGKISGTGTLTKTNSGTLAILTTNDYSGVTIIGQGILQLGDGTTSGALGTGAIQNSGTLVLNLPGSNTFINGISGTGNLIQAGSGTLTLTASNSYSGGTTISNGTLQINTGAWFGSGNVTNNGALVFNGSGNSTVDAVIGGTGTIILANSGTVTLTGNNTYSGGTTVSAGTLLVNNSAGSGVGTGAVVVAGTGTLGGGGVIGGPVTINSGGIFAPGNPAGTLTVSNNFTAGSGAVLNYTLGTSNDQTVVSGNLNLSGTLNITAGSGFTSATYTLFTYGGALTLGSLTVTLPANTISTIDTNTPGLVNLVVGTLQTNIPAFPGALGFGAGATGARIGGTVYHVTTLADSGAGSFRDAVSQSGRIIVFDVGGYISLSSAVSVQGNLYIAGQTAPGGGIGFKGGEISFANSRNIICRYIRIRPGSDTASSTDDALSLYRAQNVICDHVSLEFGPWNNIDAVSDDWQNHPVTSITFQNCLDANPTGQQFGAHTESVQSTMSWFYCVFANSHNRNPLSKINDVFVNNVLYNCSAGYTTHTSTSFSHDIVNNYFIAGPASSGSNFPWYQVDNNQSIYYTGNLYDSNSDGALNGSITTPDWYQGGSGGTVLSAPWSPITTNVPTYGTVSAFRIAISRAGALPRDQVDDLVISQMKTLGNGPTGAGAGTAGPDGSLYTSQTQTGLGNNGYGFITGGTAPLDTDQDGLPDYWEQALGSDPNVADSLTPGTGGYTKLENYVNWLAGPHAVVSKNSFGDVDLRQYTGGFTNASPVYGAFSATNGTVALQADGHTARFTPTANFSGLGSFNFSVRANDGSAMTNTVGVLTTATGLPRNLIWRGDGVTNNWDSQSTNWLNGANPVTFNSGDTVTFDGSGSNNPAINLVGLLQPASVTVAANQNYTFGGSGSLGGVMSLAKSGAGILTIGTSNTFTGGTTVSAGTLQVNNPSGSATGTNQVLVAGGATLSGNGIIGGPTTFDDGAILAPGNGGGTLTISNELDLSDLTVLQFGLGTNSGKVVVSGNLVLSGLLNITDLGGFGAGIYTLMTCGGALSGTLPVIGSKPSGYSVTVNTNTAGQVRLVVQGQTPPVFGNIVILNDAVVFGGSGGPANVPYYVLTSTNIALPVANWTRLLTNYFDPSGNFTVTNPVNPGFAQSYFLLQLP